MIDTEQGTIEALKEDKRVLEKFVAEGDEECVRFLYAVNTVLEYYGEPVVVPKGMEVY